MSSSSCWVLPLRMAKPISADEGDDETERGAVHGLGDAFGEDSRLLAGVDRLAADGAEGLDQARDGPEQTREHGEVREEREVAGTRRDSGNLAQAPLRPSPPELLRPDDSP